MTSKLKDEVDTAVALLAAMVLSYGPLLPERKQKTFIDSTRILACFLMSLRREMEALAQELELELEREGDGLARQRQELERRIQELELDITPRRSEA